VVTVGRYVDFKAATILAMMRTVERLRDDGLDITYTTYGGGPLLDKLVDFARSSRHSTAFTVRGEITNGEFGTEVTKYHAFFGMGGAVVRAAMLGVPSIVAIQRRADDTCYGLFSSYDHAQCPMFGDPDPSGVELPMDVVLREMALGGADRVAAIGAACKDAARVYGSSNTVDMLRVALHAAVRVEHEWMTWADAARIRAETWSSRLHGRSTLHA
jgi:hypothetical protein